MIDGRTVMEISSSTKSPEEIAELWSFLNDRLKGRETSPLTSGSFVAGAASSGKAEGLLRGAA
jgi:chromosome partitioning protein